MIRSKNWCFTINNPTEYHDNILTNLTTDNKVFELNAQEEKGDNNTLHIQGFIRYNNQVSFNSIKKQIPKSHIEKAKLINNAWYYCSKPTFEGAKRWEKKSKKRKREEEEKEEEEEKKREEEEDKEGCRELRPWQKQIKDILLNDDRTRYVHWIVDEEGNKGKSFLCKHFDYWVKNSYTVSSAKASDIKYTLSLYLEKKRLKYFIMDIPRNVDIEKISYNLLEDLKNGKIFSNKYESTNIRFRTPAVLILSNNYPIYNKLSIDRWKVYTINCHDNLHEIPIEYKEH